MKERALTIDTDREIQGAVKQILLDRSISPYELWKKEQHGANNHQEDMATDKQVALISKHLQGTKSAMIREYLGGRKPEDLTKKQASQLISSIFNEGV